MAPQQPPPPEIEGFLKKLKRKTSNLSGSWNKRWFFVDPKRREFGYANSKAPGATKSSIYLNDITAVVQFDDTHFQVESRTRNFFLCGESKASTTCWVKSLDEYRKKMVEYEKEKARYDATLAAAQSQLASDAKKAFASMGGASLPSKNAQVANRKAPSNNNTKPPSSSSSPAQPPSVDKPDRESFSSSSSSSSSSLSSNSKRASRSGDKQARMERRSPSPAEDPAPMEKRSSRDREQDRSRERGREKDRECSPSASKSRSKPNVARTNSRQFENRTIGDTSSVRAHPGKGYVMQAWGDDD